jgi:hypothetical protein
LRKPLRTYLSVLKQDCIPPGPIGNILATTVCFFSETEPRALLAARGLGGCNKRRRPRVFVTWRAGCSGRQARRRGCREKGFSFPELARRPAQLPQPGGRRGGLPVHSHRPSIAPQAQKFWRPARQKPEARSGLTELLPPTGLLLLCLLVLGWCLVLALLFNRISLIPQTSTTILPLVGYGGSLLVE